MFFYSVFIPLGNILIFQKSFHRYNACTQNIDPEGGIPPFVESDAL